MVAYRAGVPDSELLDELDDETAALVSGADDEAAVATMLDEIEALPLFSMTLRARSRWLTALQVRFQNWQEEWDVALEPRLLLAIAETAQAAHETSAAMTALNQAIHLSEELGCLEVEVLARAARLPWLALDDGRGEMERIAALCTAAGELPATTWARLHLARAAVFAGSEDWDAMRHELANVGRLAMPRDDRIVWVAFTSQVLLARMGLRSGQRAAAAMSMIEAARIVAELGASAELANLQTLVAAFAVRTGSFEVAMNHATAAIEALATSTSGYAQVDPWLGLPLDISAERDVAGAIRATAEAVLASQEAEDRIGFLVAVSALVAFYLASDRAPEALDALNEAQQAAADVQDAAAVALIRSISESLLRYMGMLS